MGRGVNETGAILNHMLLMVCLERVSGLLGRQVLGEPNHIHSCGEVGNWGS